MSESCVGAAVRLLREQRGLSARALSLRAGLSPAYVFKLEAGTVEPSLRTFGRLALALDMSPTEAWVCLVSEATCGADDFPTAEGTARVFEDFVAYKAQMPVTTDVT